MNVTGPHRWRVNIRWGNVLVPIRQQTISWTRADLYLRRHMVSLGQNDLLFQLFLTYIRRHLHSLSFFHVWDGVYCLNHPLWKTWNLLPCITKALNADRPEIRVSRTSNSNAIDPDVLEYLMTTSSNGNIFRVTGLLCGEFTGNHTKASGEELWCFLWSAPE